MTENKETQFNKIDFEKKMKDAESDIEKINDILADVTLFRRKADDLFEVLNKNLDYFPYIISAKIAKGMAGNKYFNQLSYQNKRTVFVMIREAITTYVAKELADKMHGDDDDERNQSWHKRKSLIGVGYHALEYSTQGQFLPK